VSTEDPTEPRERLVQAEGGGERAERGVPPARNVRWFQSGFQHLTWAAVSRDGRVAAACFWTHDTPGHGLATFDFRSGVKEPDLGVRLAACGALSHDGGLLAVAGAHQEDDQTIRVFDRASERQIAALTPHRHDPTLCMDFSPDGSRLVIGGLDATVAVLGIAPERKPVIIRAARYRDRDGGHFKRVYAVAFAPDGGSVMSGSRDSTASIWSADDGRERVRLHSKGYVQDVAFIGGGQVVATAGGAGVRLWQAGSGRLIHTFSSTGDVNTLAASGDGRWLAGGGHGFVALWDLESGRECARTRIQGPGASPPSLLALSITTTGHIVGTYDNGWALVAEISGAASG
jgi:WD40 repeat protein